MTKYILFVRDKTFLLHSTVTAAPAYNLIISNNWNNWIILKSGDYNSPQFQVITSSLLLIVLLLLSLIWTSDLRKLQSTPWSDHDLDVDNKILKISIPGLHTS